MTPKISIIIPVYNVEKYLRICLDSVIGQSFRDIEIICVNDGSNDGSGAILTDYAGRDTRIKVIEKENSGYGHSMNMGIEAAKGKYIGIVESDDKILPDFYETLYKAASENNLDIVKSECFFWWEDVGYQYRFHLPEFDRYYGLILPRQKTWLRCQFLMNTWTGLYRREFLGEYDIKHHESPGASYQDNGFWMQGMLQADKMMVLDYAGYFYRQDNEMASIKDEQKVYAMSDEYEWLWNKLDNKISREEMDIINLFRLTRSYWNLIRIADECKREFCNRLIEDYECYGSVFFRDFLWQERFEKIMEDPDGICEQLIRDKRTIIEMLDAAKEIVIYGAGCRGEKLYRIMCNCGWVSKLRCFVETNKPQINCVGITPVEQIDTIDINVKDTLVIISAAEGTRADKAMRESLFAKGITKILSSDAIINSIYLVC